MKYLIALLLSLSITLRGEWTSVRYQGAGSELVAQAPTGDGNLVVVILASSSGLGSVTPIDGGFTLIRSETQNADSAFRPHILAFVKMTTETEPSSYGFSRSTAHLANVRVLADRITGQVDRSNGVNSGGTTVASISLPSIPPSGDGSILFAAFAGSQQVSYVAAPPGMSPIELEILPPSFGLAWELLETADPTGERAYSWNGAARAAGIMFNVLPTVGEPDPGEPGSYYVAIDGNDTEPGTQSQPWRTVQRAASTAREGDTVYIGPGFYNEEVEINAFDGNAENRITFDGQNVAQVYKVTIRRPYVTLQNIEFLWPPEQANEPEQLRRGFVVLGLNAHHAIISNNLVNATGSLYHAGIHTEIDGNPPFNPDAASNCLLIHNTVRGIRGQVALLLGGTANTFTKNSIVDVVQADFMRLFGENHVISDNDFVNNVMEAGVGFHPDFVQTFGVNGYGSRNHTIERNRIVNVEGQVCQLVEGTASSPGLIGTGAFDNWVFRNNIFAFIEFGSSLTIPKSKWYNNVFYRVSMNGGNAIGGGHGDRGTSAGIRVINNVFLDVGLMDRDNHGWYSVNFEYEDRIHDYNFVAKNNYGPVREQCPLTSMFRWCEANGINGGNPLFVDEVALDFRLLPGSPLIGAGFPLDFDDNYFGESRGGSWNIGIE